MKVVHFECGLGNQMVCYANYLLVKKYNPHDTIYMEGLIYRIGEQNIGINQWNGLEIRKIFGIQMPDVWDIVDNKDELLSAMQSRFDFNNGQCNSDSALFALNNNGFSLTGYSHVPTNDEGISTLVRYTTSPSKTIVDFYAKKIIYWLARKKNSLRKKDYASFFKRNNEDMFFPLSFDIMKDPRMINEIKDELLKDFQFPAIKDEKNKNILNLARSTNSVSIHARRSDFLQYNSDCYKYGYFKKSVNYIRKRVNSPTFFVFSEDSNWCKENLSALGLDGGKDSIYFIDWNSGAESYRDMQLMSECKHNIITKSSFGWWAAFLNKNPNKIMCSQFSEYYSQKYY